MEGSGSEEGRRGSRKRERDLVLSLEEVLASHGASLCTLRCFLSAVVHLVRRALCSCRVCRALGLLLVGYVGWGPRPLHEEEDLRG